MSTSQHQITILRAALEQCRALLVELDTGEFVDGPSLPDALDRSAAALAATEPQAALPADPGLSFDGRGINGPDKYRTRLATFAYSEAAAKYGALFAASHNLARELVRLWDAGLRPAIVAGNDRECEDFRALVEKARQVLT